MNILGELRRRARFVAGPVLGICAVSYFAYHAIHGDRGILALRQYTQKVEAARDKNELLLAHKSVIENRVKRLNPKHLDPDLLEERARFMVNYGYPDEIVILLDTNYSP